MRIRFGSYHLDDQRFILERDGRRVAVRPKVFDLLAYLVRDRDRVVPREELVEALWGGAAVGLGSLSGLVNELRKLLREEGRGHSSIRTVHARGYQFVAPLSSIEEEHVPRSHLLADSRDSGSGLPGPFCEALPAAIERALWLHLRRDVPRIEQLAAWLDRLRAEAEEWTGPASARGRDGEGSSEPIRRMRTVQTSNGHSAFTPAQAQAQAQVQGERVSHRERRPRENE